MCFLQPSLVLLHELLHVFVPVEQEAVATGSQLQVVRELIPGARTANLRDAFLQTH